LNTLKLEGIGYEWLGSNDRQDDPRLEPAAHPSEVTYGLIVTGVPSGARRNR
jgi:hypothetical protein